MTTPEGNKPKEHFIANDRRRSWGIEKAFEKGLWSGRYLVLLAVISSLIASLVLFVIGTMDIGKVLVETVNYYLREDHSVDLHTDIIASIIGSVDIFLIAVVLMIFSFGLYELFISHIDAADDTESSNILNIGSLDVLKDKIGQVIIMALIVQFFKMMLSMHLSGIVEMLLFAVAVAALALALFLLHKGKHQ